MPAIHEGGEGQGNQRRGDGKGHVLLGIPGIALGSQVGHPEFAAKDFRGQPLDHLVERGGGHEEIERQEITSEATGFGQIKINLPDGIGGKEAITEVDQTVEMVPLALCQGMQGSAGDPAPPFMVGDSGASVVRADFMKA